MQKENVKENYRLGVSLTRKAVRSRQAEPDLHKSLRCGFTLIELLVVVLIIGILAAVAVPQYQKAVERSKATQALTLLKSTVQAATSFRLASGDFPTGFDELSIDIPWTGSSKWTVLDGVLDTRSNADWSLQLYRDTAGTTLGVYVGRLSGKYKGAGFITSVESADKIVCAERFAVGVTFDLHEGDYCEKIMKGTPKGGTSTWRRYTLP